jgi:hypothetical protein
MCGQILSRFVTLAADNFEIFVCCMKHLGDSFGAFSNLSFILSSLSLHCLVGFLCRSDPVDLTFLISLWMPVVLRIVIPGNLQQNIF